MAIRSMTDVAFELMKKKRKPITFRKLWDEVSTTMGFTPQMAENKIAQFYSNLSLDSRFVVVEDNRWDLRMRRTYQEVHKDLSDILDDSDEEFEDYEEIDEESLDEAGSESDEESIADDEDY